MGSVCRVKRIAMVILPGLVLFSFIISGTVLADEEPTGKDVKYVKFKGGLNSLIKFAKSRGKMIKEAKGETKAYLKLKKAIDRGKLEKGQSGAHVEKRYGSPVITLPIDNTDFESWIYKPGEESFFEGEKIYLIFDKENKLAEWKILTPEK